MKGINLPYILIFVVISVGSLVLGAVNYIQEEAFFARAEQDTATLTHYIPDPNYGTADFCPVYEFTTKAGQNVSYTGESCVQQPDQSTIGQTEKAYIDPKNPYTVESRGWTGSEGSGLILGIAGFLFFSLFWIIPLLVAIIRPLRSKPAAGNLHTDGQRKDAEVEELRKFELQELRELRNSGKISEEDYQKRAQRLKG